MGNVNFCSGMNITVRLSDLLCCCKSGPKTKKKRHNFNKTIVFKKITEDLDYSLAFSVTNNLNGLNMTVNTQNKIISAHEENIFELFGTEVNNIVGLSLDELSDIIPITIIQMIHEMINSVHQTGSSVGCQLFITDDKNITTSHLLLACPIVNKLNTDKATIYSIMLIKQPYSGVLGHRDIITEF